MNKNISIWKRISLPAPIWWVKFGNRCVLVGLAIAGFGTFLIENKQKEAGLIVTIVSGFLAVFGKAVSMCAVDWDKVQSVNGKLEAKTEK